MGKLGSTGYLYIDCLDWSLPYVDKVEGNKNMNGNYLLFVEKYTYLSFPQVKRVGNPYCTTIPDKPE
jgi:hypothetical protein